MDRGMTWAAFGTGVLLLALVVWAFFATLLPFPTPETEHPIRGLVPFAGLAGITLVLGYLGRENGARLGFLCAMPGTFLGGMLGLWAALQPRDLLLVPLLMAAFILAGTLGGALGSRPR